MQTTESRRVFIDSSVLVAASISGRGSARDLLREGFRGMVDLSIGPEGLEETERNLRLKAPEALSDFYVFRDLLVANVVDPPEPLVLAAAEVVAWKDAPIVAAAVEAGAIFLATYDRKHLLRHKEEIRNRFGVLVATPEEVLAAGK